jgi:PAS domain S-box-containing protein
MSRARILIVEDEPLMASELGVRLADSGYEILGPVGSAAEAVDLALVQRPDLILMDIVLPGNMDGIEAALRIQERADIPVVYLTACTDEDFFRRAKISGPFGYLLKPVKQRELELTVEIALYRHRMENKLRDANRELESQVQERTAHLADLNWRLQLEVDERRGIEQSLRESEVYFRQLAENVNEVFWIRDLVGDKMVYVSPAYEDILGQSCESLLQEPKAFMQSIHPQDLPHVRAAFKLQQEWKKWFAEEYRIVRPDGGVRWIKARNFPVRNEAGQIFRVAGVAEDITERKESEAIRVAHERTQRDALVAEVHHRIKNNLQGVIGLLRQQAVKHPEMGMLVEGVTARISAIAVVHGLHSKIVPGEILLCEMVAEIVGRVADAMWPATAPLLSELPPKPVHVEQEEAVPLALLLNELIMNAMKHGAAVRVSVVTDGDNAEVRIANHGTLPPLLNLAAGIDLGNGLELVKALLPLKGCGLSLTCDGAEVCAQLSLSAPVIYPLRMQVS